MTKSRQLFHLLRTYKHTHTNAAQKIYQLLWSSFSVEMLKRIVFLFICVTSLYATVLNGCNLSFCQGKDITSDQPKLMIPSMYAQEQCQPSARASIFAYLSKVSVTRATFIMAAYTDTHSYLPHATQQGVPAKHSLTPLP